MRRCWVTPPPRGRGALFIAEAAAVAFLAGVDHPLLLKAVAPVNGEEEYEVAGTAVAIRRSLLNDKPRSDPLPSQRMMQLFLPCANIEMPIKRPSVSPREDITTTKTHRWRGPDEPNIAARPLAADSVRRLRLPHIDTGLSGCGRGTESQIVSAPLQVIGGSRTRPRCTSHGSRLEREGDDVMVIRSRIEGHIGSGYKVGPSYDR